MVTVLGLCVCATNHAQQTGQSATPTDSALHWLHFQSGAFSESTAITGVYTYVRMALFSSANEQKL